MLKIGIAACLIMVIGAAIALLQAVQISATLNYPNAREIGKIHYPLASWRQFVTDDKVTDVVAYYEKTMWQNKWEYVTFSHGGDAHICFNRYVRKGALDNRTDYCSGDDAIHNYFYGEEIQIERQDDGATIIRVEDN